MLKIATFTFLIGVVLSQPQWLKDVQSKGSAAIGRFAGDMKQAASEAADDGNQRWESFRKELEEVKDDEDIQKLLKEIRDRPGHEIGLPVDHAPAPQDLAETHLDRNPRLRESTGLERRDWDSWKAWALSKWHSAKDATSRAANKTKELATKTGKKIKDIFTQDDKRELSEAKVNEVANLMANLFMASLEKGTDKKIETREITDDMAKRDWADVKAWIKQKWEKAKQKASPATSKIKEVASDVGSAMTSGASKVGERLKDIFSKDKTED